jgi:hypothetical protein
MRKFLAFLIITATCNAAINEIRDVITDPVISRRCKLLLKERQKKIRIRQRLNAMILRNQKLQQTLETKQKVAKHKLELNKTQLKNNLRLTAIRVQSMEEDIIRKGCPGITL